MGKNQGKANEADVMVGVLLQTTQQGQRGNEIFYRQLEEVSQPPALALFWDFNSPDVCQNTAERNCLEGSWNI